MRRILFAVLVGAVALAVVPATGLARSHHRKHHRRHHHAVRHQQLGHDPAPGASAQSAGTIKSFTGGVLMITLNDGSTVSGQVTDATEIKCEAPDQSQMQADDHGWGGGDRGGQGDQGDRGDQGDQGDGDADDQGAQQACTTADLMPGVTVQDAQLKISSAGSVWEEVELAPSSSSSSSSSS